MKEWNAAVDLYIQQSTDMRWNFAIEAKAKIDSHGGPLYKRESQGCINLEGMDVEALKCCSGYKLVGDAVLLVCGRFSHCYRSCTAAGSVSQEIGEITGGIADPKRIVYNSFTRSGQWNK